MHHHRNPLAAIAKRDCVQCPETPAPCLCKSDQKCVLITTDCDKCAEFQCLDASNDTSSGGKGVSGGAVAGAVIGSLILLGLVVGVFFWYRRRSRALASRAASPVPKEAPANASDVLNRPDPNEKVQEEYAQSMVATNSVRVYPNNQTYINLDPEAQLAAAGATRPPFAQRSSNPFSDAHSIQTMSTDAQSPNTIPIALVRRVGGEELAGGHHLNLEHLNVSKDSMPVDSSAARNSYASGMTNATDFLNEAPMIVTGKQVASRQVMGMVKAEVVRANSVPPTPTDSLNPNSLRSKASMRSPLAQSTFGPTDTVKEVDESNPFHDQHTNAAAGTLPIPAEESTSNRPISMQTMATNAGSILTADISSAKRVQVGHHPGMPPVSGGLHRVTSARLVTRTPKSSTSSPTSTTHSIGTLQEQQERALAYAQLKAQEAGLSPNRRVSDASVSTRADSILESFPFVPPSPISDRPMRTPPRSPLAQQSFANTAAAPSAGDAAPASFAGAMDQLEPPNRAMLGRSVASEMSTASTGLGGYAFAVGNSDADYNLPVSPAPPSAFIEGAAKPTGPGAQRQRASLDTLALTADLSSYPLGIDPAAHAHYPVPNARRQ